MGFFEQFPFTNYQQQNVDWILKVAKKLAEDYEKILNDVAENTENIKTNRDDIDALKNNPNFAGDWEPDKAYKYLTVVYDPNTGNSYTAKKDVPAGTLLSNGEYWALTGNFNQQLDDVSKQLTALNVRVDNALYVVPDFATLETAAFEIGSFVRVSDNGGLYKIVADSKLYTPASFKIASGMAVLIASESVNFSQLHGDNFADKLNFALQSFKEVRLSYGTYHADKAIIVGSNVLIGSEDIQNIPAEKRVTVYGPFVVNGEAYIQGIYCEGWGRRGGRGFTINNRCKLVGCVSQNWDIGFHSTDSTFTVGLTFDTCRASDCKQYGFYIEGSNTASKNITTIKNCYANKCGTDFYNYSEPGTPNTGHGYYIKQSLCLNFTNNTAEYNSGYGLLLEPSFTSDSDFSYIDGATIANNYFEQNKMCQIGVDCSTYGAIRNTTFADNYFVMPHGLMSNTKTDGGYWFSNFDIFNETYNNAIDVGVFSNITTYRAFSPLAYKYGTTAFYNVAIKKKTDRNTTEFSCRYAQPVIGEISPNQVYAVSFTWWIDSGAQYVVDVVNDSGDQLAYLVLTGTGDYKTETFYVSNAIATGIKIKFSPYQDTPSTLYFYDVRIDPVNVVYASSSSKPKYPQLKCVLIDESSKAITVWNGSSWV